MNRVLFEVACPKHGFERFSIKVVKRYNIPSTDIRPRFRKLKPKEICQLCVGRNVTDKEIKKFLNDYLLKAGVEEIMLRMTIVKVT